MAKIYYDQDADISFLKGKSIAMIGYGNQGSAQAQNLRDSGAKVVVGSIADDSAAQATKDGFSVYPIAEAARQADIIMLLIPDEAQKSVYEQEIAPNLSSGKLLDFAHGYNLRFGFVKPPADVDVTMVAPRTVGINVRRTYEKGTGVPAYVAVWQDATGKAKQISLAIAKGIGCTRAGVIETTIEEETDLDLFTEQATWPIIVRDMMLSWEVLVEQGFSPEVVTLELWGSGEAAEIFHEMARLGMFEQMSLHSQTSQYGALSRGERMLPNEIKGKMRAVLDEIRSGDFAKEWNQEETNGYPRFRELKRQVLSHPLCEVSKTTRKLIDPSLLG
jgi:ketol-acid reductoisomerase